MYSFGQPYCFSLPTLLSEKHGAISSICRIPYGFSSPDKDGKYFCWMRKNHDKVSALSDSCSCRHFSNCHWHQHGQLFLHIQLFLTSTWTIVFVRAGTFPIVLDINMDNSQLQKALLYLKEGFYLDQFSTKDLSVSLIWKTVLSISMCHSYKNPSLPAHHSQPTFCRLSLWPSQLISRSLDTAVLTWSGRILEKLVLHS